MNKTYIATMGERFFMSKIAIATDSNSGITQAQGRELGIFVMPMPFYINDELFLEDITLSQEQFYQRLEEGADVKTTQPAPGDVLELWDRILKDYDELVYIPMSSGLSSSCETAVMLAQDYSGRVQVVNNQRISVTLRQSALDAQALAAAGRSAAEIKALLEQTKFDSDIYITVDTLKYLKKGPGWRTAGPDRQPDRRAPESPGGAVDGQESPLHPELHRRLYHGPRPVGRGAGPEA